MSDRNTRRGNRVYVTDRERESIHMLIDKMPYDEWQSFVKAGGEDPETVEERNTWYVIKEDEDSYDSDVSNRLRESRYSSEDESVEGHRLSVVSGGVLQDGYNGYDSSSEEFEFKFGPEKVGLPTTANISEDTSDRKRKFACKLGSVTSRKRNNPKKQTTKTTKVLGDKTNIGNTGNNEIDITANGVENATRKKKIKRRSNNSFPDRPVGKTRYEQSIGQTVFVPKGYCTASFSRGKVFCGDCMLKPCLMEKDKKEFDDMWCNLEIVHCRPSGYVERKLRGLAHSKMVHYFGPTYVGNLANNGVPACFDARLSYYIDTDCESGDEPDGDDVNYGAIVRGMIEKTKSKRANMKKATRRSSV
jgi:hypothetical protein